MSSFRSNRNSRKPYSRPSGDGQWLHDKAPGFKTTSNGDAPKKVAPAAPNTKLLVSNLHYEITPKDLISVFGQIGTLVREPLIKYDRSGRSTGVAIISYETAAEATKAKQQFNGLLAKGQPMTIEFDIMKPRRTVSDPSTLSLLNRVQKPPLAQRLSRDDSMTETSNGPGPIRGKRGRGNKVGGQGGGRKPGPKKPKTAEELDKELDAFMGDASIADPAPAPAATEETTVAAAQDVEMT